ncbi:zinc finger, C2H2 type [Necator americanus]|uniref:Zinc finger, C2H2 type n=1 Tax=Necator americanus TaxID=51031 RepID=W2TG09_NECAM|nr:zinc finger, C2H2 type [Necator americanus]ETN80534.1 zinc finger, C2H2 type [Necator americanus]
MRMQTDGEAKVQTSLRSFDESVLFDGECFESFGTTAEASSTGSRGERLTQCIHSTATKQPWHFIDGMRGIELVDSKCYRTPHGFQKEATFPCESLFDFIPTTNNEDSGSGSLSTAVGTQLGFVFRRNMKMAVQDTVFARRSGPLERFTLMIGENILQFKVVKGYEHNSDSDEPWNSVSGYKCSLCGKIFPSKTMWEKHIIEIHSCSVKELHCDICGAVFTTKVSLALHMRFHTGPRPFRCTICTKTFCRSSTLALHMKMHVTGHRHFCQICGRWFKSGVALADHENIHERVHTGEKPYTCGYCGRGFTQSQTLTIHIRTHTGEKPYPCHICGQEFRDRLVYNDKEMHAALQSSASPLYEDSTIEIDMEEGERLWNERSS